MPAQSRYANLTVQLPDGRILLHRKRPDIVENLPRWRVTVGEFVVSKKLEPLQVANRLMWEIFGINANSYSDNFVEAKVIQPLEHFATIIHIFTLRFKTMLAFEAKSNDQYKAMLWDDLVDDVISGSVQYSPFLKKYSLSFPAINLPL